MKRKKALSRRPAAPYPERQPPPPRWENELARILTEHGGRRTLLARFDRIVTWMGEQPFTPLAKEDHPGLWRAEIEAFRKFLRRLPGGFASRARKVQRGGRFGAIERLSPPPMACPCPQDYPQDDAPF